MDNLARELVKVARGLVGSVDDIVSDLESHAPWTDFGGMKTKSVKENVRGDKAQILANLYFDKAMYIPSFVGRGVDEREAMEALVAYVQKNKSKIIKHMEQTFNKDGYPMWRIVGGNPWTGGEEYEDISAKVTSIKFGKPYQNHGETSMPAEVKVTFKATKLPDMSKGPYDEMSNRELAKVVEEWADYAPEWFWMDGEYRGSYQNRVRDLMGEWRSKTPHAQRKHYEELKSYIRGL